MKTKKAISRHRNSKNTKKRIIKSSSNSNKKSIKSIKRTNITRKRGYISKGGGVEESKYVPPHRRKEGKGTETSLKPKGKSYRSKQYVSSDLDNNKFIEIRPYPLNASTLQHMCNKNKISIDTDGNVKCEPGLVVNVSDNKKDKVHSFSRDMTELWEDETTTNTHIKDNTLYTHVKESEAEIDKKYNTYTTQDITYFQDLVETLKSGQYDKSDLQFTDYNIIEDFEGYKIVGYPDPKHLGPILANSEFMAEYENIAKTQIHNSNDEIVKLYNVFGNSVSSVEDILLAMDRDKKHLESMLKVVDISED